VTISGRAYAFNHAEVGLAGATIRVRELPGRSAVADAQGDYALSVPDDTNVTPYIEPPAGYHQIDLQTFHTRGEPIENANFQTPGDAEYNGLAALLSVPLGPDGRPEQCVIVTTASARNVRGVDFDTFRERTPHGVAGATAHTEPALPGAIYFNDSVIPDRARTETSGDGGIIWTAVPAGTYRVIADSASTNFGTFLATCEPGRIVNASPPWGAYEIASGEGSLDSAVVIGKLTRAGIVEHHGRRFVMVSVRSAERLSLKLSLRRHGRRISPLKRRPLELGMAKVRLPIKRSAAPGPANLSTTLFDAGGDGVIADQGLRVPAPPRK
jgi:hypothetical protein